MPCCQRAACGVAPSPPSLSGRSSSRPCSGCRHPRSRSFSRRCVLIAAWEWCGLSGIIQARSRATYLVVVAIGLGMLWHWPQWQVPLLAISAIWWAIQAAALTRIQRVDPVTRPQPLLLAVGLLVLLAPWAALVRLHRIAEIGPVLVFSLLILIWTADSLAYFVGRRWGRTKLAPAVSPGKTREGVYGALFGAALCGWLFARMLSLDLPHSADRGGGLRARGRHLGRGRPLRESSQAAPCHEGFESTPARSWRAPRSHR